MNLVIREYLAALRERDELDAILPDLLSEMGLTVFSRPRRGTRQDGVDVGAVGSLDGREEKVYLFSIKAGHLTRAAWDGDEQALRASLNSIASTYVRNRLPVEHREKHIVVCVCVGGDVREEVRTDLVSYFDQCKTERISFEEWNGDRLAQEIQKHLLREELLPKGTRSNLRKSLALLDQPESSFAHFASLVKSLALAKDVNVAAQVTALRQMGLCLRILFAWCREAGSTEAAFRAAEFTLLQGWPIFHLLAAGGSKAAVEARDTYLSIYDAYHEICMDFLRSNVVPHASTLHGLSSAVRGSCALDVKLKLFDLLSRVSLTGLWMHWTATRTNDQQELERSAFQREVLALQQVVKAMVVNNPTLFLPATEDQSIDLGIALLFLALNEAQHDDIRTWLHEILRRAAFELGRHGRYPCTLRAYNELVEHPRRQDEEYRREVTAGSILYPLIAIWAALLDDPTLFREVVQLKEEVLGHCTFQYWFPDESSERFLYGNGGLHGATLPDVCVERGEADLLKQVLFECDALPHFQEISAIKLNWWPIVILACRHYRLPVPLHFLMPLQNGGTGPSSDDVDSD